jgi:hypothetical protein
MRNFIICIPFHISLRWLGWGGQGVQHELKYSYAHKLLVRKLEGKISLERSRYRWEDYIKIDLKETEWGGRVYSSCSGEGPVTGCCEHGNELSVSIIFWGISWLAEQRAACEEVLFITCCLLYDDSLFGFSVLKMEEICSSETSVDGIISQNIEHFIVTAVTPQIQHC